MVVFIGCETSKGASSDHPIVIVIFIGDQYYGDLGFYGTAGFETPKIGKTAVK
ncbi:hypothetical protein [Maribacter sp. 4U21]|uniref:hypothetical protein n=1 Tax=Maribacter sp. 4U21 TaxID=1889779 RepID=UPI0015D4C10F|nr:hypothetical protein [Maribacter sp. 4U21]